MVVPRNTLAGVRLGLLFPKVPNPGCVSGDFCESDPIRGASRATFAKVTQSGVRLG